MLDLNELQLMKDLIFMFKKDKDNDILTQIISRINGLIMYTIQKYFLSYNLAIVDSQDLYNTAILGVYNAINSISENEDPAFIPSRFVFYIRAEIVKTYPDYRRKGFSDQDYTDYLNSKVDPEPIWKGLELEDIRNTFDKLVFFGVISEDEYNLIHLRFAEEVSITNIALGKKYGCEKTIRDKLDNIRQRVKIAIIDMGVEL